MKKMILFIIILFFGLLFFTNLSKKIDCKDIIWTDKIINSQNLKDNYKLFFENGVNILSDVEYSTYMNSQIKNKITLDEVTNIIKTHIKHNNSDYTIKYKLIENDKLDPNKKSQSCKLYAGSLTFEFYNKQDMVYKIYIEFIDKDGKDIAEKIKCVFDILKMRYENL